MNYDAHNLLEHLLWGALWFVFVLMVTLFMFALLRPNAHPRQEEFVVVFFSVLPFFAWEVFQAGIGDSDGSDVAQFFASSLVPVAWLLLFRICRRATT